MKTLPSASVTVAPLAFEMNRGVPPTERNARTGELTPPGMTFCASWNSFFDVAVFSRGTLVSSSRAIVGTGELYPPPGNRVKNSIGWNSVRFLRKYKTSLYIGLTGWKGGVYN